MYQIWHCHIQLRAVASRVCCLAVLSQSGSLSLVSLFQDFSCFPLIEVVDTAPANYNFLGTRGISVIDPVASESEEEKKDSKQGSEEDTYPNSPSGTPEVQSRKDASVKELERVFRRAMWPSLTLTITVMVVCVFSQSLCYVVLNIHATHRSYLYRCSSRTTCFLTRSSVFG